MRQVFTSPRIENVEGVARLLENAGIETRITNGRSFRGAIRGNFSYRDSERERKGPQPAVWIVKSEDQPRARTMLREAGLLDSTRLPNGSYLLPTMHSRGGETGDASRRRAFRLKAGLLALIAVAIGLGVFGLRKTSRPARTPATAVAVDTAAPGTDSGFLIATPPALAQTLLKIELEAQAPALACIAVDGKDPPTAMLTALRADGRDLVAMSACRARQADVHFDITQYRTDGSGVGTVRLDLSQRTGEGGERRESRTLEVERTGDAWRIVRMK